MNRDLDDLLAGVPAGTSPIEAPVSAPMPDPVPWTAILTALASAVAALCLTALMILRVLSPEAGVPLLLAACGIAPLVHKQGQRKAKQATSRLTPDQRKALEARTRRRPFDAGGVP